MDWSLALRFAPVRTVPTKLARVRSAVMRAPDRSAPSSFAPCICAATILAFRKLAWLKSASNNHAWSRMGAVELRTNKPGPIETCSSQSDAREVKSRQVEWSAPLEPDMIMLRF